MEFLILNEASIPYDSIEVADEQLPNFLNIVSGAFDNRVKAILLSNEIDRGWFELPITPLHSLREWLALKRENRDFVRKVKFIITKTSAPQIPSSEILVNERHQLSNFFLKSSKEISVPSLGAAYLLKQLAVSFASAQLWLPRHIPLLHNELTTHGETRNEVIVNNCATIDSWEAYLKVINQQRKVNLKKSNDLWNNRREIFPNLIFCGASEGQLQNLQVADTVFNQLLSALEKLNNYCEDADSYSLQETVEYTQLRISDESNSVKQNPKLRRHRMFMINGRKTFFGFHIKSFSGALRLYFLPDRSEQKIYIGYFGKHLPTANY
ncbi:hypothetical protein RCC89_02385 [Cytophagaceae bacterium ABcell3]|nr:hypothetical protein RCC89_02385 [Cytophagaceae bacterium ABcell3]